MKIGFWGRESLDLFNKGGIGSVIRRLLKVLAIHHHTITVMVISEQQKRFSVAIESVAITFIYDTEKNLEQLLLQQRFDVLNFLHFSLKHPLFLVKLWSKKKQENTLFYRLFFTYPVFKHYKSIQRIKYLFLFDKFIGFSTRLHQDLANLYPKRAYLQLPIIPEHYFNMAPPLTTTLNIAFVGRISKDKGLDVVIEVFKTLQKRSDINLTVMGYYVNSQDKEYYHPQLLNLKATLKIASNKEPYAEKTLLTETYLPLHQYQVLLLPYQDLSPTLDTPLLVLEGLAAKCSIVTSSLLHLSNIQENITFVNPYQKPEAYIKAIETIVVQRQQNLLDAPDLTDYSATAVYEQYIHSIKK